MPKQYDYDGLNYPAKPEENLSLQVKFVSDANSGSTTVNNEGVITTIKNQGSIPLGTGSKLRDVEIVCSSSIANIASQEDEIVIDYLINNTLVKRHSNKKSEEEKPEITLFITFKSS